MQNYLKNNPIAETYAKQLEEHFTKEATKKNGKKVKEQAQKLLRQENVSEEILQNLGTTALIGLVVKTLGDEKVATMLDDIKQKETATTERKEKTLKTKIEKLKKEPIAVNHLRLQEPLKATRKTDNAVFIKTGRNLYDTADTGYWLPKSEITLKDGYVIGASEHISKKQGLNTEEKSKEFIANEILKQQQERTEQRQKERQEQAIKEQLRKERQERAIREQEQKQEQIKQAIKTEQEQANKEGLSRVFMPLRTVKEFKTGLSTGNYEWEIVKESKYPNQSKIDTDTPSIQGGHLLGYEGEQGVYVYARRRKK